MNEEGKSKSENLKEVQENKERNLISVFEGNEYDIVKYRHSDQVQLLQKLTDIDLKLFFGYLAAQFTVASFIVTNTVAFGIFERLGIMLIDFSLTIVILNLLKRNYIRRNEVTQVVKNCNEALGLNKINTLIEDKSINEETAFKPWFSGFGYKFGLITTFIGVILILFFPFVKELFKTGVLPLYLLN